MMVVLRCSRAVISTIFKALWSSVRVSPVEVCQIIFEQCNKLFLNIGYRIQHSVLQVVAQMSVDRRQR